MQDLIESTGSNAHEFTVSEISGAVKRVIEGEFARVRVRGEIGRVSRPSSGHLYFDLKDDRAVIAAVAWKGQAARMNPRPEEGMEVIATGRLTTFPGQSKYQLLVDSIEPAGAGALMMMLEKRRQALAAEGLFDSARKRPLPTLPRVIGVVTSPSGAVIRDILHRLRDRFPTHVLIWPVAVQGQDCAPQVAAAIRGFNAIEAGGKVPRPDLIIVARGGGSLEDLWGFNEEAVVRAAAQSAIPLISAVGHETDTTLIDHAADRRAPTPTAAAEMAVPVRADLAARLADLGARMGRASLSRTDAAGQRLRDLARALGRPQSLTEGPRQMFDFLAPRLAQAQMRLLTERGQRLGAAGLRPRLLLDFNRDLRASLEAAVLRLGRVASRGMLTQRQRLGRLALSPAVLGAQLRERRAAFAGLGGRLSPALTRRQDEERRRICEGQARLGSLSERLLPAVTRNLMTQSETLVRLDRLRQTLGYRETLRRGFVVVREDGGEGVLTHAKAAQAANRVVLEFADGRVLAQPLGNTPSTNTSEKPAPRSKRHPPSDAQGSLF